MCEREMMDGVSCNSTRYSDMPDHDRIPWRPDDEHRRCPDCWCPAGGFHHPGCDTEQCPVCGDQAISCECVSAADGE